jgi:hypothetical protein
MGKQRQWFFGYGSRVLVTSFCLTIKFSGMPGQQKASAAVRVWITPVSVVLNGCFPGAWSLMLNT